MTSTPVLNEPLSNIIESNPSVQTETNKNETKPTSEGRVSSRKTLQKSKTCSIIESRCILKKSISDPTQSIERNNETVSLSNDLQHFAALQVTKSLWNLQDFEAFASKSGKKFEKFDCRLPVPVIKSTNIRMKLEKSLSSPETTQSQTDKIDKVKQVNRVSPVDNGNNRPVRSQLPRAISVWDVSSLSPYSSTNSHPLCTRTSSGSKIPVKKLNPQRLAYSGRSNSFCDQSTIIKTKSSSVTSLKPDIITITTSSSPSPSPSSSSSVLATASPPKIIQVGKVLPTPKRTPGKITNVNKIVKNLNELSNGDISKTNTAGMTTAIKRPGSTISSISLNATTNVRSTMATTTTTVNTNLLGNKKYRLISSASSSSTPHSLNKIGISTVKASTTVTLSSTKTTTAASSSLSATSPKVAATMLRKTSLKCANSELSLNTLKCVKGFSTSNRIHNHHGNGLLLSTSNKKSQHSDVLLNKCLEKGQEILRKVEAFGNVTKLERGNEYSKHTNKILQQQTTILNNKQSSRDQVSHQQHKTIVKCIPQVETSPPQVTMVTLTSASDQSGQQESDNQIKIMQKSEVIDKRKNRDIESSIVVANIISSSSSDVVDGCYTSLHVNIETQKTLPNLCYAKECSIEYPRLESCKIIPPLLCHPSQQHAELLVNVKTTQQPLRVHQDSMLCINSDIIRSEKDYHSDCSDDSGHISNENDEIIPSSTSSINSTNNVIPTPNSDVYSKNQKGIKIIELLEKFESSKRDSKPMTMSSTTTTTTTTTTPQPIAITPLLPQGRGGGEAEKGDNFNKKTCTTIKVAEVKPVKSITSSMEIYPTYSSEVIIQIQ